MKEVVKIDYVKEYPKDENFILSVDCYYYAVLNEQKFLATAGDLMAPWGISILDASIGLVETPYGKSGWTMCFSTSQKAVLVAAYLKATRPDEEIQLNMTEVAPDLHEQLFEVIKSKEALIRRTNEDITNIDASDTSFESRYQDLTNRLNNLYDDLELYQSKRAETEQRILNIREERIKTENI